MTYMNMELIVETLDIIGKVIIAYTALAVHHRFRKEHKVDEEVFHAMRKEHILGLSGIFLIVLSYVLRVMFLL